MGISRRLGVSVLVVVWVLAMAIGARSLLRYSSTPGQLAHPPVQWPVHAPIALSPKPATLLLFVHPQCPCSRATLEELAHIIACCRQQVETTVFFYEPPGAQESWTHSDLWASAARMPGVRLIPDPDAAAARRFGARTSGQTLLYERDGKLLFNGGITALRGHSGDNDGRDAIVDVLQGGIPRLHTTPVFGCALFGDI